MYCYKRILMGINLNEDDLEVIRYANQIIHMTHSEKVLFNRILRLNERK